jgi:hypothetical protein
MKHITFGGMVSAFTVSGLLFLPSGLWYVSSSRLPAAPAPVIPPPPIAVIQGMSELATTRVHLSDFIEGENGHYKGKWSLHGEVILGVDLSKVTYVAADSQKREAVLGVPLPKLIQSKVDHERSEEIYMKKVAWIPLSSPKVLRDEIWRHADRKLQRLGEEPEYMERTKSQTESVLQKLFEGVGWTVRVEWQETTSSTEPQSPATVSEGASS